MGRLPSIGLTMGDPAGIGPELAVRAAADAGLRQIAEMVLYGCPEVLAEAVARFAPGTGPKVVSTGMLAFSAVPIGAADAGCGLAARDAVIAAANDALSGKLSAIVTCPMNKASVNLAGVHFTGHTELIAELCGVTRYAMRQSAGKLRVAFVTTHIPLREVCDAVTFERVVEVTRLLWDSIVREGVSRPRLAMAALNPHAGENGFMGKEEILVLGPALKTLRGEGMDIDGPFPPDTLFIPATLDRYDGVVSMYHDQGHIPFKAIAFDRGVNTTLGLPIVRTSPDHGTAFDIAWKGQADTGSLFAAIRLAADFAKN